MKSITINLINIKVLGLMTIINLIHKLLIQFRILLKISSHNLQISAKKANLKILLLCKLCKINDKKRKHQLADKISIISKNLPILIQIRKK